MRIVFAHCMNETWVAPVVGDLYRTSEVLDCELFVIGRGPNSFIHKNNYIDLDCLETSFFSCLSESLRYNTVNFTEQVDYEKILYQLSGITIHPEAIKSRLESWFSVATALLKIIQPDIVIVWNGMLAGRAVYAQAAQLLSLPLYYAEKGMLPDSWYIDPQGINPLSTVAKSMVAEDVTGEAREEWKSSLQMIDEKGDSAWEQPARKNQPGVGG